MNLILVLIERYSVVLRHANRYSFATKSYKNVYNDKHFKLR